MRRPPAWRVARDLGYPLYLTALLEVYMLPLVIALLIAALVCFLIAAFVPVPKVNLVALGLALWVITLLIGHIR